MTLAAIFVLLSLLILLGLLAATQIEAFKLFGTLLVIYYFFGLIEFESMMSNFVNISLITLITLILVSFVLEKSTWIQQLSKQIIVKSEKQTFIRMGFFVGLSSAFLNNTAVVATMLSNMKNNPNHASSKLLIPLSYIAILGGTLTLIGTSTNLIINSFVIQAGLPPLSLFDFLYVGLPLLILGLVVIILISSKTLPDKLEQKIEIEDYVIESTVPDDSKIIGYNVQEAGLRKLEHLFLAQIFRNNTLISPVAPTEKIHKGDVLIFSGDIKKAPLILKKLGLVISSKHVTNIETEKLVEVVLSHSSNLIGKTLKQTNFRTKFNAVAIAIKRGGEQLKQRISDVALKPGDTLVLAVGDDFEKRDNLEQNFYFYNELETQKNLGNTQSHFVIFGFLSVLALSVFEYLPLVKGLLLLLASFIILRFITFDEIRRRFPYQLVIVIGAALGVASVIIETGVAQAISNSIMQLFSVWGVMGSLIGVFLFTLLLTEMVTNNAAAALGFPIALATSELLGVSPWPFIMAVAYAASASFLTPYSYQTNLMVYGAGQYQFKDYIKAGLPLSVFYSLTALILIPVFFPFNQ